MTISQDRSANQLIALAIMPISIMLLMAFSAFIMAIPNQPAALMLPLSISAFYGGRYIGLASSAIHVAYAWFFFSGNSFLSFDQIESFRRVLVFAVVSPVTAFLMGYLRDNLIRAVLLNHAKHLETKGMISELGATIAHETKQPITALIVESQALSRRVAAGNTDLALLAPSITKLSNLAWQINSIIDRLTGGLMFTSIQTDAVALDVAVKNAMESTKFLSDELKVDVFYPGCRNDLHVIGDHALIQMLITNLLKNAIEAASSREFGSRKVAVDCFVLAGKEICIDFSDSGPGLKSASASHFFEPAFTTKSSGFGLGLSLSKRIAKVSGGDVEFASTPSKFGGAKVRATLPLALSGTSFSP